MSMNQRITKKYFAVFMLVLPLAPILYGMIAVGLIYEGIVEIAIYIVIICSLLLYNRLRPPPVDND